jgi:hypothetical protein
MKCNEDELKVFALIVMKNSTSAINAKAPTSYC